MKLERIQSVNSYKLKLKNVTNRIKNKKTYKNELHKLGSFYNKTYKIINNYLLKLYILHRNVLKTTKITFDRLNKE